MYMPHPFEQVGLKNDAFQAYCAFLNSELEKLFVDMVFVNPLYRLILSGRNLIVEGWQTLGFIICCQTICDSFHFPDH